MLILWFLGCDPMIPVFWRNLLPLFRVKDGNTRFFQRVVPIYQTMRHHIPEDHNVDIRKSLQRRLLLTVLRNEYDSEVVSTRTSYSLNIQSRL
jgi:hypothetical protein